jgi:hypothetical protein
MYHLLGFGAAALDASAGDVQLPAIADQLFTISSNNFQLPEEYHTLWAYAGGATMTRARIETASLRLRGFPQIFPVLANNAPPTSANVMDTRRWPIRLKKEEDLRVSVTNGAANNAGCVVAVTQESIPNLNLNARDLRIIRFTATSTLAEFAWAAPVAITFQDVLEGGTYAVYGLKCQATNLFAARLIFPNQYMRPGTLGEAAVANYINFELEFGGLGKWGEFTTYAQPQLECLGIAAGAQAVEGRMLVARAF